MNQFFDTIIIGAGSAGCVLAHRLAEAGRDKICVIEAGPKDRNPFIHIPAGFTRTIINPKVNWMYQAGSGSWTGSRSIAQPRGKTLGGSGSINGNIFNRGQAADFDRWAREGSRGWAWRDLLPYFIRMENYQGLGDERYRGRDGPLHVTEMDWRHPLLDAFLASAQSLGIPRNPDYNGASQSGASLAQRTIYQGRRASPARAFLKPALASGRITVLTECLVDKILFERDRAVAVEVLRGDETSTITAHREIVLSAGVFNSPQILLRSGIGPAHQLASLGIPLVRHLPAVGENLRDHCYVGVSARVGGVRTINELSRGFPLVWEVAKYLATRRGILSLQPSMAHVSWKSSPHVEDDDIQLSFAPGSYDTERLMALEDFPGMTCAAWQHRPESKGFVRLASRTPRSPPIIEMNYLEVEEDRRVLIAAAKLARAIFRADPLSPYFLSETNPGEAVQSDDEWLDVVRAQCQTCYHPMGTCRMGPPGSDKAVVDPALRLQGFENLHIADASIMPDMLSANLNAATLMIGEKAADIILGKAPLSAIESEQ